MKKNLTEIKKNVITACRVLSHEDLVRGFGHVSARIPESDRFVLTPRVSLALVREKDLLILNLKGEVVEGKSTPPFETALHTAIYKGRSDINAAARIHGRRAGYFSVTGRRIEPVHNHGSFFYGGVPVFPKTDLISTQRLGEEVVEAMERSPAILLRGNGQVTIGRTIPEAVMMAIYLEEAADMLYGALQVGTPTIFSSDESSLRKVESLPPVDLERAWNFYKKKIAQR